MRTFRELLGWALWPAVPLALLVALSMASELEGPRPYLLAFSLLAALAWPGLSRLSRRLRDPLPEELAEADGRRSVALLHSFTRSRVSIWRRLFVFQREFWRDRDDARLERALEKSLGAAGPVVPLARPTTARSGPVAMLDDSKWRAALERQIKHARMVAVALDESPECVEEVLRAADVVGLRKLVLIAPMRRTPEFLARFASLRGHLPQLPALASDTLAIRFTRDGQPLLMSGSAMSRSLTLLGSPAMMLFEGETNPAPQPPAASWFLTLAALGSGIVASVAGPVLLSAQGQHIRDGDALAAGMAVVGAGVMMAFLSRRAVRLVPSSELPMVFVAASPWLLGASIALTTPSAEAQLEATLKGAAYAYALLLGAGFVLAGGALIRRAPGRRITFGLFGPVAVLPIATLVLAMFAHDSHALLPGLALVPAAIVFGLALVAASGDAGRPHAPLPIGAAVAATLAVAAATSLATSGVWRRLISRYRMEEMYAVAESVATAYDTDRALIAFLCVLPALATLVTMLHARRVSRVSIGNVLSLLPLLFVLPALAAAHAEARTSFSLRYRMSGAAALTPFVLPPEGFNPASITCGETVTGPMSGVLGRATLSLPGSPPLMLSSLDAGNRTAQRALRDAHLTGRLRLLVSDRADPRGMQQTLAWAAAVGAPEVELVGVDSMQRRSVVLGLEDAGRAPPAYDEIRLFVQLRADATIIAATDGTNIEVSSHDYEELRDRLDERLLQEPDRRTVYVVSMENADRDRVLETLCLVQDHYPDVRYNFGGQL